MPSFVPNGPDIPVELLHAHEQGNVVFFCGSGVGVPFGMPDFKKLILNIYTEIGYNMLAEEKKAFQRYEFDRVLWMLEKRLQGSGRILRKSLHSILACNKESTTHEALLQLATTKQTEQSLRIVTTNYDHMFAEAANRLNLNIKSYQAPILPSAKRSRWNGIVYLHGFLPDNTEERALDHLVLHSGDFGLAYLNERWASRFITELFQHYTVCFVGYSINDTIMRYMMDSLAAEAMLGEVHKVSYAFVSAKPGKASTVEKAWYEKGVVPIVYDVKKGERKHHFLHNTLRAWAKAYGDGLTGKQMVVVEHAPYKPSGTDRKEYPVGRMLWALTNLHAARFFATLSPPPPLEWLQVFIENNYSEDDLPLFGLPLESPKRELKFSLFNRPGSYQTSGWLSIVATQAMARPKSDEIMEAMVQWLLKHLNSPDLLFWMASRFAKVGPLFPFHLSLELHKQWAQEEKKVYLQKYPDAIPEPRMRQLWELYLAGAIKRESSNGFGSFFYEGARPSLPLLVKDELLKLLEPKIEVKRPGPFSSPRGDEELAKITSVIELDITLATDDPFYNGFDVFLASFDEDLVGLLDDFVGLLRRCMELSEVVGKADYNFDRSAIYQPHIANHPDNRHSRAWTWLIELVREAWLLLQRKDPVRAKETALSWFNYPYPVFKRLTLFALSNNEASGDEVFTLLASDGWQWLWSGETAREVENLLGSPRLLLTEEQKRKIESIILLGPPDTMKPESDNLDDWLKKKERWRDGTLFTIGGCWPLGAEAKKVFEQYLASVNESIKQHVAPSAPEAAPQDVPELCEWLLKYPEFTHYGDDWSNRCTKTPKIALSALINLVQQGRFLNYRWHQALSEWARLDDIDTVKVLWQSSAEILSQLDSDNLKMISDALGFWLAKVASLKLFVEDIYEELFIKLSLSALEGFKVKEFESRSMLVKGSHEIAQAFFAYLLWITQNGKSVDSVLELLKIVCDVRYPGLQPARWMIAMKAPSMLELVPEFTRSSLLPLFDWQGIAEHGETSEALNAWEGFLFAPSMQIELISELRRQLLDTAKHCSLFEDEGVSYSEFLTFSVLNYGADLYPIVALRNAYEMLNEKAYGAAATAIWRAVTGAGDDKKSFYINRVSPFIKLIWSTRTSPVQQAGEKFALIYLEIGDDYPESINEIKPLLRFTEPPSFLLHMIEQKSSTSPEICLNLLNLVVNRRYPLIGYYLDRILSVIREQQPNLASDSRFLRLLNLPGN